MYAFVFLQEKKVPKGFGISQTFQFTTSKVIFNFKAIEIKKKSRYVFFKRKLEWEFCFMLK